MNQLKIDKDVLGWIVSVMSVSTIANKKQRESQVAAFAQQKQRLEDRLDKMYLDKLDGVISDEEYARLNKKFRSALTDVKFKMESLAGEKEDCIDNGNIVDPGFRTIV